MKVKSIYRTAATILFIIFFSLALTSCQSGNKTQSQNDSHTGYVDFGSNLAAAANKAVFGNLNERLGLFQAIHNLEDADRVIVTVQHDDGSPTDYTLHELIVYKIGDDLITNKISLPFGDYKITEFHVSDSSNDIIFSSPLEGSLMAQNVNDPLPVFFDVTEEQSKSIHIEIVSTANLEPDDFGLINFPLNGVDTFQFLVSVSELGANQLLAANLTASSDSYSYSQELDASVDSIVTLKDGYDNYIITIDKIGYLPYSNTFSNAELKQYEINPLIIELEKNTDLTERIVYQYSDGSDYEISAINLDGTDPVQLTNTAYLDMNPYWFKDKSRIVFVSRREGGTEIFTMDPDGSNVFKLTSGGYFNNYPSVSWDRSKIVFSSIRDGDDWDIYIMDVDGSNLVNLTPTSNALDNAPSISPDGQKILFESDRDGNMDLFVMNVDGSSQINISNSAAYEHATPSAWSPDGNRIVFCRGGYNGFDYQIYTMDPDGSNIIQLTTENRGQHDNGSPSWSIDGQVILFSSFQDNVASDLFKMSVDGSNKTRVTFFESGAYVSSL